MVRHQQQIVSSLYSNAMQAPQVLIDQAPAGTRWLTLVPEVMEHITIEDGYM
jgi:hypothetical protein